jgi:hypothetical protein
VVDTEGPSGSYLPLGGVRFEKQDLQKNAFILPNLPIKMLLIGSDFKGFPNRVLEDRIFAFHECRLSNN